MSNEVMNQNIRKAIEAGERALTSLRAAKGKLKSSRNWGFFDMFGGGLFSSMMKRSQMDDATRYMEIARLDLKNLQRELQEVRVPMDLKIEVGGFLSFADIFLDNFLVDYMVQMKIEKAGEAVEDAIFRVESILMDLRNLENNPR